MSNTVNDRRGERRILAAAVAAGVLSLMMAGCSPSVQTGQSVPNGNSAAQTPAVPAIPPVVGKWTGEAKLATGSELVKLGNQLSGGQMTGASSMTLKADGKGYLKVAKAPEKPITWTQDGDKLTLTMHSSAENGSDRSDAYVGTLSHDQKEMSIDMGQIKVKLSKKSGSD